MINQICCQNKSMKAKFWSYDMVVFFKASSNYKYCILYIKLNALITISKHSRSELVHFIIFYKYCKK